MPDGKYVVGDVGLTDELEAEINPATEDKQDDIIDEIKSASISFGDKDIAATGVEIPLGTDEPVRSILIQAKTTNASDIYVGVSGHCSATEYMKILSAGDTWEIAADNMTEVYINGVIGEGVNFYKFK